MRGALRWLAGADAGRAVQLGTGLALLVWLLLLAYARAALAGPWAGVFLALAVVVAAGRRRAGNVAPRRLGADGAAPPARRPGCAPPGLLVVLAIEGLYGTSRAQARLSNPAADAARRANYPGPEGFGGRPRR